MQKKDVLLIAVILVIAAGIWLIYSAGAKQGLTAVVTVEGEKKAELSLKENDCVVIHTDWGQNTVCTENGQAWVTQADCRDQICVAHKKIAKVGETIVCLPHKLVIEIIGNTQSDIDMVVG